MKAYECQNIRNVGVFGHAGAGKTSLVEALLFNAGVTTRLGSVADGNSVTDYDPEAIKRKHSTRATLAPLEHNDCKINLIDTPGYIDFFGETVSALRVVDGAIFLFDGVNGYGVGSDILWQLLEKYRLPRVVFINRLDKERSDFRTAMEGLRAKFGARLAPVMMPLGAESSFSGYLDLTDDKAYRFEGKGRKEVPLPPEAAEALPSYKEMLLESLAEVDDTLMEEYLENKPISKDEILAALKKGTISGKVVPVIGGSATKDLGPQLLAEAMASWLPDPCAGETEGIDPATKEPVLRQRSGSEPFSAYVFKTVNEPHVGELSYVRVYSGKLAVGQNMLNPGRAVNERVGQITITCGKNRNEIDRISCGDIAALPKLKNTRTGDTLCEPASPVIYRETEMPYPSVSLAVRPKSKSDQEKMGLGLSSLTKEDPTFRMFYDPETKETVVSGMGDLHLEIFLKKLKERTGIEIETAPPRIPYKETIHTRSKAQGKYKKQTGGHGQYGDTWIEIEPLPRGKGFEFVDRIVGGAIPRNYIPAVEKGLREAMEKGVIAGYPVVDLKATLCDGSYHEVDSSDLAFKIAASMGFKDAFREAKPSVLEPIVWIEVTAPAQYIGDVVSDLNKRRAHIESVKEDGITARVPLAEIQSLSTDLRSFTHGTGSFFTNFSHYQEVLPKVQQELVSRYQAEREKGGHTE
ncbi:MAG TPA: elongation factor G [Candidatus Omnitrophota bacterium]|nr:elongation factor G [Candidatus Omnitrophota bacterium]